MARAGEARDSSRNHDAEAPASAPDLACARVTCLLFGNH